MGPGRRLAVVLCFVLSGCATEHQVALGSGSAPLDDLQVQRAVQRDIDRMPPVDGNRVDLLRDGAQAFPAMFAAMRHARDSINLEFYTFDDVRSGGQTLGDVLVDRLRHGVAVSIIYDAFGSGATPRAFLDRLAQAGAVLVAYNADPLVHGPFDSLNDRDHRKLIVIDGRTGFMGGINLDHVYENPPRAGPWPAIPIMRYWRDTSVRLTGPVVADLQRVFFNTWARQHGPPLPHRDWFPLLTATDEETVTHSRQRTGATTIRSTMCGCCTPCARRATASVSAQAISCRAVRNVRNWPERRGAACGSAWCCPVRAIRRPPFPPAAPRMATC